MIELSKKEKALSRELFDHAIELEFDAALKQAEQVLEAWGNKKLTGRLVFHKLRDYLNDFRKHLAHRYDGLRPSDYLMTVAAILNDGYIKEEDLKNFSDESKAQIKRWIALWQDDE